jgi:hypothetical protein
MAIERIRDIANDIRSGAIMYRSSLGKRNAWRPAGVVLRLDTGEWDSEARLFVLAPDRTLTSLGQFAEAEGDLAVDLGADHVEVLERPTALADVISRYEIVYPPDVLAPLELQQRIDVVPAAWIPLPDQGYVGNIRAFTMIGSCTMCAPHNPHLPSRCTKCPTVSTCNWE